jgi:hypothetical protein
MKGSISMPVLSPAARLAALAAATVAGIIIVGAGGCSSKSTTLNPHPRASVTPSPSPLPSGSPTPAPSPTPAYFIALAYAQASPTIDPTYGQVDGMSSIPGPVVSPSPSTNPFATPGPSQIIAVNAGQKIRFYNYDLNPHTASNNGFVPFPGATWPPTFNNINGGQSASPQGDVISDINFSTGTLGPGSLTAPTPSLDYFTGAPSISIFMADAYTYNPIQQGAVPLRTIFIVF